MHTYLEPPSSVQHQGREPRSTAQSIPCCHSACYWWSACTRGIRVFKVCVWECVCVFFMCEYCGFWLGLHTLKASRWGCVRGALCICARCHPYGTQPDFVHTHANTSCIHYNTNTPLLSFASWNNNPASVFLSFCRFADLAPVVVLFSHLVTLYGRAPSKVGIRREPVFETLPATASYPFNLWKHPLKGIVICHSAPLSRARAATEPKSCI